MSHEIDNSLGFDAFARASGTDKAWHGLGQVIPADASLQQWQQASGTDWECLVVPSQYEYEGKLITSNNFHMVRSDTGASLGVMSERYKPVQPREVWEFFKDFISTDERFTLETGGALKGGKVIWALAKFSEDITAGGDQHKPYVLLTTSYDGKLATTAQATMIRVVCNNTLTASLWDQKAQVKVRHCTKWTDQVKADCHEQLAEISGQFEQYKALSDALAAQKMTKDATEDFLRLVFFGKKVDDSEEISTQAANQLQTLRQAYVDTIREGTEVGTAWAALNAVTRYVDHERTTRDHNGEGAQMARMASSFYGSGAAMKARALDVLVEYAEDNGTDFASLLQRPAQLVAA